MKRRKGNGKRKNKNTKREQKEGRNEKKIKERTKKQKKKKKEASMRSGRRPSPEGNNNALVCWYDQSGGDIAGRWTNVRTSQEDQTDGGRESKKATRQEEGRDKTLTTNKNKNKKASSPMYGSILTPLLERSPVLGKLLEKWRGLYPKRDRGSKRMFFRVF